MRSTTDKFVESIGFGLLSGLPLRRAVAIAVFAGALVFLIGAAASVEAAIGLLAAMIVLTVVVVFQLMTRRVAIAEERIEARLTLDELQRGVAHWKIATSFSVTPVFLMRAVDEIFQRRPGLVVELGAGVSTVVLARIIRAHRIPVKLVSVEHDAEYAEMVSAELKREGLLDQVKLLHCPLVPLSVEGYSGLWYETEALLKEADSIGLLLVDGPPERHGSDIRFAGVPALKERMAAASLVLLDDAERRSERRTLWRWSRMVPGGNASFDTAARGIGILRWPDQPR
jgi:hypothetical protein